MSNAGSTLRLAFLSGLATLALGVLAPSAMAAAFTEPVMMACKTVSSGGTFSNGECKAGTSGSFAWGVASGGGTETTYCVLGGSAFSDSLCSASSGSGPYKEQAVASAFPEFVGTGAAGSFSVTISSTLVEVACTGVHILGQPSTGKVVIKGKWELTGCVVNKPAHCAVLSPGASTGAVVTKPIKAELTSKFEIELTPEGGTTFLELEFVNNGGTCTVARSETVTGTEPCQLESAPAIEEAKTEHELNCGPLGGLMVGSSSVVFSTGSEASFVGTPRWRVH
jgi:hypothetical protein